MLTDEARATIVEALEIRKSTIRFFAAEDSADEMAAIDAALAEVNAMAGWEPVEDGEYTVGNSTLWVGYEGAELEQWVTGNVYKDGSPRVADEISLGDYRLCRRTSTGTQQETRDE